MGEEYFLTVTAPGPVLPVVKFILKEPMDAGPDYLVYPQAGCRTPDRLAELAKMQVKFVAELACSTGKNFIAFPSAGKLETFDTNLEFEPVLVLDLKGNFKLPELRKLRSKLAKLRKLLEEIRKG